MDKRFFLLILLNLVFILSCRNNPTKSGHNIVEFNDVNFENLIRETFNKPTGDITAVDMQSIIVLRGFKASIIKLKGIEYCTNLEELYLGDNDIEDITPLANLEELKNLSLHFNNIIDLTHLSNLTKLQSLVLADNKISDISPLENLTGLHFLKVGGNKIVDIQPLVQNNGIGDGDAINMVDNPLSQASINVYIPELQARGVRLYY